MTGYYMKVGKSESQRELMIIIPFYESLLSTKQDLHVRAELELRYTELKLQWFEETNKTQTWEEFKEGLENKIK